MQQNLITAPTASPQPGSRPLRIGIIAGEHSGDLLGADLIRALRARVPNVECYGIGGARMAAQGFRAQFDMEELAVMGIVEVLGRLPRLLQVRREILAHFASNPPDLFIGIDAPDFNLPVELALKNRGIKTVHYVSPSVWAWRQKRIFKIAAATHLVLALLPFEKAFYDLHQVPCTFVGHTLADQMPIEPDKSAAKKALDLAVDAPMLALMPGSRTNEIKLLAADFLATAQQLRQEQPRLQLVCNMVTEQKAKIFLAIKQQVAPDLPVQILIGKARQTLTAADVVLIASGTATLEAMLAKTPMVVAYKANWLTYQIASRMVKVDFFSLPNLLAKSALVTELLQYQVTVPALLNAVRPLFGTSGVQMREQFTQIHRQICCQASERAVDAIMELLP